MKTNEEFIKAWKRIETEEKNLYLGRGIFMSADSYAFQGTLDEKQLALFYRDHLIGFTGIKNIKKIYKVEEYYKVKE